ncbi:hypothetical protein [Aromatoleum bremense]|uniref:Tetratricopeptide repeat protein n=1 Tax=Aromatoleum bremense TaxID=76115 RepID=A0ABX1NXK0_9RHOO|nr:hypothetical protein [Aromatoleum bremense]NMG16662.1 hypothetical protein [Aromatoleum bremense]QTQ33502.1 tetratricopeptide repeat-containing protein [Aromatoleum bremense]
MPNRPPPFTSPLNLARWLAFALFAALAAWRIVTLNLADHYADAGETVAAAELPGVEHPVALTREARQLLDADPQEAVALLQRAVRADPTYGLSYALLGALWEKAGDERRARSAIDAAAAFAPAKVDVRLIAAGFELGRNDLAAALRHSSVALTRRGSLRAAMFPELLRIADEPANRAALSALLAEPVAWWPAFVAFAANKGERLETVMALYALSEASVANSLQGHGLAAVLRRLQREGLWLDARLAWMSALPVEQLEGMGNVFNGGFEQPLSGVGFDWVSAKAGHVLAEPLPTPGATGAAALNVVFRGPRVRYRHLSQHVMLEPGSYVLRGRVRPDGLEAKPGLTWTVACIGGAREREIGVTEYFSGRSAWRKFETPFTVPAVQCPAQVLRLQLGGQVALDFEASGPIWFDDIVIERLDAR